MFQITGVCTADDKVETAEHFKRIQTPVAQQPEVHGYFELSTSGLQRPKSLLLLV